MTEAYTGAVRRKWIMVDLPLEEFIREELEATIRNYRKMRDWRFDAMQWQGEAGRWKVQAAKLADELRELADHTSTLPTMGAATRQAQKALEAYESLCAKSLEKEDV